MRTKECEKLSDAMFDEAIILVFLKGWIWIFNEEFGAWRMGRGKEVEEIIARDGFEDIDEMYGWFHKKYGKEIEGKELMAIRWKKVN